MSGFKIYRIVCTATGKALISGSDLPHDHRGKNGELGLWYQRGFWSNAGVFWRSEEAVRRHLQNLCHDWQRHWAPSKFPRYLNQSDTWTAPIPGTLDWSRLKLLKVERYLITEHTVTALDAGDFMGIAESIAA